MSISSVNSPLTASATQIFSAGRQEKTRASVTPVRIENGRDGSAPWNTRSIMDGMKQKLAGQVMAERGLNASSMQAMPSEQRAATEREIGREVDRMLQASMERIAQGAAESGRREGALLNVRA